MNKTTRLGGLKLGFLTLALVATSTAAEARSFIWKLEPPAGSHGVTCHLLGSIHLANKAIYPLAPEIEAAYKAAEVVALEARIDKAASLMGMVMQHAMYLPPDALDKHISKRTLQLLRNRIKTSGLPAGVIMGMKPWVIAMTLSALELKKLGFDPQHGIDMHFLSRAKADNKGLAELEGAEFQIKLFSGFSDKEQEAYLLYTLARSKLMSKQFAQLVKLWKRGDGPGLHRAMTASLRRQRKFKKIFKVLITDRNRTMTETMVKLMGGAKPRPHLFVVGAGHLTGPRGIVRLLKKQGYRLTQL
jgi:uncharacterized protein YbaP (TraB family)